MQLKNFLTLLLFCGLFLTKSLGQNVPKTEADHSYKPLKLNLSEDGKKYIRFIMWHQLWLTTNNLDTDNSKLQITPSIRRSRFLAFSQISPKFLILTHFGLNGLSPNNLSSLGNNSDAPQFFLHGAWGELMINKQLYIGSGLHYWKGLSRLANASTLNFMTLDQSRPFTAWHSLGITDQFARHLGVYAKGQIGNFDYRIAANAPGRSPLGSGRDYSLKGSELTYTGVSQLNSAGDPVGNAIIEGYFRYNFWDKESTKLPYAVGTYLGKKKVFNIGVGFFAHPNGMYNDSTGTHGNVNHFAIDAFLDMPVGATGNALNTYVSVTNFNYGENYVSRWGGTGTTIYGQVGYFLKSSKLMPYLAYGNSNYEGYDDPLSALDIGLNYFINGHNCKLSFEYHRIMGDVREGAIATQGDALSQLRMQLHVFL